MALTLYDKNLVEFTSSNPFRITMNGIVGGEIVRKIYMRNTESIHTYDTISLSITDNGVQGTGWVWKLQSSNYEPTYRSWHYISHNNGIAVPDINDHITYVPIWVFIKIPDGLQAENIEDLTFSISARQKVSS